MYTYITYINIPQVKERILDRKRKTSTSNGGMSGARRGNKQGRPRPCRTNIKLRKTHLLPFK